MVSKTQEKRARRAAETKAFVAERRTKQLSILETNFEVGVRIYEENKDKLSTEEDTLIQEQMKQQRELLDKLRDEAYPRTEA